MAKFKKLTEHGTEAKLTVNMDRILFIRSHDRSSHIYFSEQHSIEVAESVKDIMRAEPLPHA
jgi:hypothetical protein